jgi:hypothetical protein
MDMVDNGENWVSAVLGTCDEIFRHMASVACREKPKRKKTCLNRRLAPHSSQPMLSLWLCHFSYRAVVLSTKTRKNRKNLFRSQLKE